MKPVRFIVTGTDTGIGKTVFCAGLSGLLGAAYWKPVQSGLDGETDSAAVMRLGGLDAGRVVPSAYTLRMPASPHLAAAAEGVEIETGRLEPPDVPDRLVIEGAGGALVPLTMRVLYADLFAAWGLPVIVCARTALGTINHTLLTLEALRARNIAIHGVAFVGAAEPEVQRTIGEIGRVKVLGRLPLLDPLDQTTLRQAFADAFPRSMFEAAS